MERNYARGLVGRRGVATVMVVLAVALAGGMVLWLRGVTADLGADLATALALLMGGIVWAVPTVAWAAWAYRRDVELGTGPLFAEVEVEVFRGEFVDY